MMRGKMNVAGLSVVLQRVSRQNNPALNMPLYLILVTGVLLVVIGQAL